MADGDCPHCLGTGRFMGKFSGSGWPSCPECAGSGKLTPPSPFKTDHGLQLFERFGALANGSSRDAVLTAAINLLIGVVSQSYPGDRAAAGQFWDSVCEKGKEGLLRNFPAQ